MPQAISPSLPEFRQLAGRGNLIPLVAELVADSETPISAFAKIQEAGDCFLFESAEKSEQLGRFSFIGFDPIVRFQSTGSTISIKEGGEERRFESKTDPLGELEGVMSRFRFVADPSIPHFVGGAIGYIGFDLVPFFEPTVPLHSRNDLQLPDMIFLIARVLIVFDHRFRRLRVIVNALVEHEDDAEAAYETANETLESALVRLSRVVTLHPISAASLPELPAAESNTTRAEYESMVEQARELIS